MRHLIRLLPLLLAIEFCVHAQSNPLAAQFESLMGKPKTIVNALGNFPWKTESLESLPGFKSIVPQNTIRIVSVERPIQNYSRWKRWESQEGDAWVDLVSFVRPFDASETLRSARQRHAGYHWGNQLLLFSGTGDKRKEAVGTALITANGSLLNVGMKLPLEVHWDRPLAEPDRVAFNATITRLQTTLEMLARALLDPAYVSFDGGIAPRPESLPILRMASFARLWSYVKYNFVYLDKRPDVNWDAVLEQYMPRIAAAKDDSAYVRLLQEAVALLKDGHTNVYPNVGEPVDAPLIQLEPVEGRPIVTAVGSLPELSAIQMGMELLEIDSTPVDTIIKRDLDPYISSSTTQDRQLRRMRLLLVGPPGSTMRTKWLSLDGKTVDVTLARNSSQNRSALKLPSRGLFESKDLPGNIAYIALNDFSNPEIVKSFELEFNRLLEAKAWIIDLRFNGGGSSDIGYRILAHFIQGPTEGSTWRTRQYNPTFQAWGEPQTWYEGSPDKIEPAAGPRYEGPVYVLTSPSTCSAAEDFLVALKMAKRIAIVGEPTCGSTGQPLVFSIYGATARVCTKWDRFPDGREFVGVGILPDVQAARSKKDVASGRDAVLQSAIDLAQQNFRNSK